MTFWGAAFIPLRISIKRRGRLSQGLAGLRMMYAELTAPDPVEERIKRLAQIVPRSQSIREAYDRAINSTAEDTIKKARRNSGL